MDVTIKEFIANVLGISVDQLTDDLSVGDIPEWDSMRHMMIVTGLQKKFDIIFHREELIDIENVADIVSLVQEKVGKA